MRKYDMPRSQNPLLTGSVDMNGPGTLSGLRRLLELVHCRTGPDVQVKYAGI